MDIDKKIAATIVNNLKSALSYDINLFDTTGTIIASTNPVRVGTSHGAAQLAIETGQTVCVDDNHQFAGARNGVNIPVYLYDTVVAVIGITGERKEVESYGNVIRKMTEILIRENLDRTMYSDRTVILENLVDTLTTVDTYDPITVAHLFHEAHLHEEKSYCCIVGLRHGGLLNSQEIRDLRETIITSTEDRYNTLVSIRPDSFCIVMPCNLSQPHTDKIYDAHSIASNLYHKLENFSSALTQKNLSDTSHYTIGIGTPQNSLSHVKTSYIEARQAAQWASMKKTYTPVEYDNLDMGLIFPNLDRETSRIFLSRVFSHISKTDIEKSAELFFAYKKNSGSITHTAKKLFLHKNTVQNRLNKIAQLTGYNPRNLNDFSVLDCAFQLYMWTKANKIELEE